MAQMKVTADSGKPHIDLDMDEECDFSLYFGNEDENEGTTIIVTISLDIDDIFEAIGDEISRGDVNVAGEAIDKITENLKKATEHLKYVTDVEEIL